MKNPQIIIIPILMLLDYYLTIIGNNLREKKYSQYIKVKQYELNPIWQKDARNKKLLNPRHLACVLLISFLLYVLTEILGFNQTAFEGIFGFIVVIFGMIIGRHISNILLFYHMIVKPDDVSGEMTFSHRYVLLTSLYQYSVALVPLVILTAFLHAPILIGGTSGAIAMLFIHILWLVRYWKSRAKIT